MRKTMVYAGLMVFLLVLCGVASPVGAVPAAVKAKSEYMLADKFFNAKKYGEAIVHAEKARKLLGKSNSRIEYLLTKAYFAQGQAGKAMTAIEAFFNLTPESQSTSQPYSEMVALYAEIELKAAEQKKAAEARAALMKKVQPYLDALPSNMVHVPGGSFSMGNTFGDGSSDEKPVHNVSLDSFYISKYEVTQGLWLAVMGNNPAHFKKGLDYPVEEVSWDDCQKFLAKLNQKTGRNYRLPTEAEWEYAARSGGRNEKYSGGDYIDRVAWYENNSGKTTHPVGNKAANGLGLYDMSGNVWEWCADWYNGDYYENSPGRNPQGPASGEERVDRGGCWSSSADYARAAFRSYVSPGFRYCSLGLRLALPAR